MSPQPATDNVAEFREVKSYARERAGFIMIYFRKFQNDKEAFDQNQQTYVLNG